MKLFALLVLLVLAGALFVLKQPFAGRAPPWPGPRVDPTRLHDEVQALVALGRRDDEAGMRKAAAHLEARLRALGYRVEEQVYSDRGGTYRNVIAEAGPFSGRRMIVGAHYDVRGPYPGADDNASGVAGVLELARLFKERPPPVRTQLVFYPNEERGLGGSDVHARSVDPALASGMVVLEMIGCFTGPQKVPFAPMKWLYPESGDYIVVVGRPQDFLLVRRLKRGLRGGGGKVQSIDAPEALPGVGNSDHSSYWRAGITAAMVTDTAWYRNPRYHTAEDAPETLDYVRMAKVVEGVAIALSEVPR